MKQSLLLIFITTFISCTSGGRQSEDGVGRLPDWAFGGFERPENVNPVISPIDNTWFYCPLTEDSVAWESNDTFNPAATIYDEEIVLDVVLHVLAMRHQLME